MFNGDTCTVTEQLFCTTRVERKLRKYNNPFRRRAPIYLCIPVAHIFPGFASSKTSASGRLPTVRGLAGELREYWDNVFKDFCVPAAPDNVDELQDLDPISL